MHRLLGIDYNHLFKFFKDTIFQSGNYKIGQKWFPNGVFVFNQTLFH